MGRHGGRDHYRPAIAQAAAVLARRRPRDYVLARVGPLRDRVIAELTAGRSPEAIWADMHAEQLAGRVRPETDFAGDGETPEERGGCAAEADGLLPIG